MTLYWLVMRALHQHTPTGRGETKLRARASRVRPKCGPTFCTFSPRVSLYGLQLETANMPGDHINERSCAIRDVVARDLRGASTETMGLSSLRVLPQTSPPPHARRHASAGGGRATPAAAVHHDGREDTLRGQRAVPRGTARAAAPARGAGGGAGAAGERRVHREGARTLDHKHSRQGDGTRYPGVREQVQGHLVGPVLAALRAWDPVS